MARIGSLFVNLALQDAAFIDGLKRATKESEKTFSGINRAAGVAKVGLAALTAAAGALISGATIRRALDYAGSLGEVSEAIGVNTRELQVYRFAATQANLSTQQIEGAIARLTRNIGEGGEKLTALGIATREAGGQLRTTGDVMGDLAEKIKNTKDPAERAAIAVAAFGRTGQALLPILSQGREGISQFADQAERMGAILSDKAIQDADKAADSIAAFQQAISVSVAGVVAANAGAISSLGDSIARFLGRIREGLEQGKQAGRIAAALAAGRGDKSYLGGMLVVRGKGDLKAKPFVNALLDQALEDARLNSKISGAGLVGLDLPSGGGGGGARGGGRRGGSAAPAKAALTQNELRLGFDKLNESLSTSVESSKALTDNIALLKVDALELALLPPITPINLEAVQLADDFSKNLSDGLALAIIHGKSLGDALVSSIKAAAAQLISSQLLKLLTGGGGAGGGGGFLSALFGVFAGARATGGLVSAGRPYLVGENGPERFVPTGMGRIERNGGGGVTQNVNVMVDHSPLFITTVAVTAQQAGAAAAGQVVRRAQSGRIMQARGA